MRKFVVRRIFSACIVCVMLFAVSVNADTTNSTQVPIVPGRSNVSFANIPVGQVTNCVEGHVGVDIIMGDPVPLGSAGDKGLSGDFDGDGVADFVVDSGGQWAVRSGVAPYPFIAQGVVLGRSTDTPLSGDFNGDPDLRFCGLRVAVSGQFALA